MAAKLYSLRQIAAAAFIGSPIAGCWLMARNFAVLGNAAAGRRTLLYGLLASGVVFVLAFVLPEGFPRPVLPTAYTFGVYEYAKRFQARDIAAHSAGGGERQSNWRVAGIGALCLVVVSSILVLGVAWVQPGAAVR